MTILFLTVGLILGFNLLLVSIAAWWLFSRCGLGSAGNFNNGAKK